MTREEAKTIFLNRGYIELDGGSYFDGNKWRESIVVISKWLKQEPCEDAVSRADTLQSFESYCENNCQYSKKQRNVMCGACMMGDAIEIVENLPPVTPKPNDSINAVLDEIKREFKIKADGDDWYHTTDGLVWGEAIEIIDKHRKAESEDKE